MRFLTGHSREGGEEALDASTGALVDDSTTLVFYMGLQVKPLLLSSLAVIVLRQCGPGRVTNLHPQMQCNSNNMEVACRCE